ncbi:MAG: hypothetical protein PUP92_13945 [Rhizonema sp. PD38]|nr:hypothetical protein [Rhizonema sp. PD38]
MIREMICLDRPTFTYSGCTYQINDAYRELGKSIITIVDFCVYRPTKQILPVVKDQSNRIFFTHWINLKPIPLGQIEIFGFDDADPDEPPEPFELDDSPKLSRLTAKDIPDKNEWRCKSGLHPVKPVIGMLSEYVVRCDNLPVWEQIRLCQLRIKGQRSRIRDLKFKKQPSSEIKNSLLIILEEKQRICNLLKSTSYSSYLLSLERFL